MKNETMNAYTQPTAPASVGVITPPRIPPMIMNGVIKAGNAATNAFHFVLELAFS
ncbi:hypothetical protein SDC9_202299 [bioreactor metagenome]|uniref:Uncharacterized protein n=1 Tax=bioreactor metagenome TaxID=1076179 RepID=A0A645ITY7_9ZZZZ